MSVTCVSDAPVNGRSTGVWRVLALVTFDALAVLACGFGACFLTTGARSLFDPLCASILAVVPLFSIGYGVAGLYPGFGVSAIQLIRTLSKQTSLIFLVIAGTAYALPPAGDGPVGMFTLWWMSSLVFVPFVRVQVSSVASRAQWWREPVLLFGSPDRVSGVVASLAKAQHLGYRPVAVVLSPGSPDTSLSHVQHVRAMGETDAIATALALGVRTVLLAMPDAEQKAADLRHRFRHVILVSSLESPLLEPTAVRYLGSGIGIEYRNGLLMRRNQSIKRIVDVVAGAAALVILFPVAAMAAVAIMVCDPGPWWHAQRRAGHGGAPFRMWKLRTMYTDAEARLATHLASDVAACAEWQTEFKLSHDPRVIPIVGGVLRRWSLDEYPQFWNVIRGDMSLVGPRALPAYHLDAFEPEFRRVRGEVRPGITGMWQVMSRGRGAIRAQEALDRYYIYNWSIWMDLFVLAKTVLAVISRRGAR